jgi:HJR/Mrr/RecB family endonuclease
VPQAFQDWDDFRNILPTGSALDLPTAISQSLPLIDKFCSQPFVTPVSVAALELQLVAAIPHIGVDFKALVVPWARQNYEALIAESSNSDFQGSEAHEKMSEMHRSIMFHIYRICDAAKQLINDREAYVKVFSGQKIHYANGQLNLEKIHRSLKTHFGHDYGLYSIYRGVMIQKLLSLGARQSSTVHGIGQGVHFENSIIELYRQLGYVVTETPSTGDFGIDVIAQSNIERIGIQCKKHATNVGVEAVMQAHSGGHYYGCSRFVVCATEGFTQAAQEMAEKLKVELLIFRNRMA